GVGVLGMSADGQIGPDLFGRQLEPDPAVALPDPEIRINPKKGPLYKVQYVLEFVGPRSVPASMACSLLRPEWYAALGQPQVFSMQPADLSWGMLTAKTEGSYDSLALTWDLLSLAGTLSSASAQHLLTIAEQFGSAINRRVAALPVPAEVDQAAARLV